MNDSHRGRLLAWSFDDPIPLVSFSGVIPLTRSQRRLGVA
jgi:hypothetical protein